MSKFIEAPVGGEPTNENLKESPSASEAVAVNSSVSSSSTLCGFYGVQHGRRVRPAFCHSHLDFLRVGCASAIGDYYRDGVQFPSGLLPASRRMRRQT